MSRDRASRRARRILGTAIVLAVALVGCSADGDDDGATTPEPSPSTSTTTPAPRPVSEAVEPTAAYSLVASTEAAELAVAVSRTYLEQAQVAVLAPRDDRDAVLRAASIGRAVGAPVLLSGAPDGSLDSELLRLGVVGVVTVGAVDLARVDTTSLVVAPAPDDVADLGSVLGGSFTEVALPPSGDDVDDVAALLALADGEVFEASSDAPPSDADASTDADASADPGASSEPTGATTAAPTGAPEAVGELPPLADPVPVTGSVVVADGDPAQVAALATAQAVGAEVLRAGGDVRGDPAAVEALAGLAPRTVVGLGATFGDPETFAWQTATAATGVQLPAGGQLVFDGARYVALYGSPITPALGVLGEQGTDETVERAADLAALYRPLTDDVVVPALEIIVTVASGGAGDDGNYSQEWPSAEFLPLIEAAQAAGQYVVLDFQPGRTSFLDQVRQYEDLLAYPHVGIALDPEWRLGPDEVHLQQIGSVGIAEVNATVAYLADFVREHRLPQKLVVLHQFQLRMITDRQDLDTGRSEVALLIHADGQGSQGAKQATWRALHEGAPDGVRWGWKNFVHEDSPTLSPAQTYEQVDPVPDFVSYQ